MLRSLGFRTDLMLRRMAGSSVEERPGYLVVRTPSNPGFWWGNFVLLADPPTRADGLAVFAAEFPEAGHVAIGVDGTDGVLGDDLGLTAEVNSVLTAQHLREPSAGIAVRALRGDDDWRQALDLRLACYYETPTPGELRFVELQVAEQRRLCEAGHGTWYGAFVEGRVRSGAGLFRDGDLARFQSVETHPGFRRRGLASAVLGHAARHEPGARTLVIVADPDDQAIRLYRALGFAETEHQVQLYRGPGS
ncbi:GNAT family N-acetyltransferase [Actinoplanes subtropicus]|uniref:GNAT family N-acetyltransferase n=1 Tax=Actinoplanes subtropicus TaxID=543632 RepID=UPI001FE22CEC|nr:GNAT family N-acetyltransferase [Actinoplanes subtropicus]